MGSRRQALYVKLQHGSTQQAFWVCRGRCELHYLLHYHDAHASEDLDLQGCSYVRPITKLTSHAG